MRNKNTAWCGYSTYAVSTYIIIIIYTYNRIMSTSAETFVRFPRIIPVFKPYSRDRRTPGRFSRAPDDGTFNTSNFIAPPKYKIIL